jgi:hypothetical protein
VLPLLVGWCVLVLLCWFAALAAALVCSTGAWLACGWSVCRPALRFRKGEAQACLSAKDFHEKWNPSLRNRGQTRSHDAPTVDA